MSRHEIGVDLIDIDRIVTTLGRFPDRFRQRVLTDGEARYCGTRAERIAGPELLHQAPGDGQDGRRLHGQATAVQAAGQELGLVQR